MGSTLSIIAFFVVVFFPSWTFSLSVVSQVSMLPENDRWSETRAQLLAQMDVSMGGRVAEELIFGNENITTGESELIHTSVRMCHFISVIFCVCDSV